MITISIVAQKTIPNDTSGTYR